MKDLKMNLLHYLLQGFNEINHLFGIYKMHLETLCSKPKEEQLEEYISLHMNTLRSLCDSHLNKIQQQLDQISNEWKRKRDEQKIE